MSKHTFLHWVCAIVLLTTGAPIAHADPLTIERLFAAPDLSGEALQSPKIAADGTRITFLRGKSDRKDQLDLWEYDLASRKTRLLVDSDLLLGSDEVVSEEETQRRERQRLSSLSGIVEYYLSPNSQALLFPLGGDLYYFNLNAAQGDRVRRLTRTVSVELDPKFSPSGRYVSFIRDQTLYIIDLRSGVEQPVTEQGRGLVKYGTAEFIAQEEMGRDTGYWWSPDETHIAFTRTDESTVSESQRVEIGAEGVTVLNQRYPVAGAANAKVQLFVATVPSAPKSAVSGLGAPATPIDLGADVSTYLARVDWFPDSTHLAIQRQSRDQRQLDVLKADVRTGSSTVLISERSSTWVPLHNELTFLKRKPQFIWASSRSGYKHLYLYDFSGTLIRPLTSGHWMVIGDGKRALLGVDESNDRLYFMANERTPLERHLYSSSLSTVSPNKVDRVTRESGWHSVIASPNLRFFMDTFSTPDRPPQVRLIARNGEVRAVLADNALNASHPYYPYLDHHVSPEFGTLTAGDGQTLHYQLIKPYGFDPGKRYPVMIHVYGGPDVQRVRRLWDGTAALFKQVMAQSGYVVFALDNRGSGQRGVDFETTLHLRTGQVEVSDQVLGANYLRSLPYVDPQRIGIFGWSYGGYMALMCMFTAPEHFSAGVAGAPVTDWRLYDTHYTERYLGSPLVNSVGYAASSVFPYVGALRSPLLLVHGMADDNVLFTNSTRLFKKLQELNKPFDVMTYPGSKHALLQHGDTGPHAYALIKRFFDTHLRREAESQQGRDVSRHSP